MKDSRQNQRGIVSVETVLVLPFAFFLLLVVIGMGILGVRSIMAQLGAMRAARGAEMFHKALAERELVAMLDPAIFQDGAMERIAQAGATSNAEVGGLAIQAIARPWIRYNALQPGRDIRREAPITPALVPGLSDAVLRDGDTPSPYCQTSEGYGVCDYP